MQNASRDLGLPYGSFICDVSARGRRCFLTYPSRAESVQIAAAVVLLAADDGLSGHPKVRPRPEQRATMLAPAANGGLGGRGLQ